MNWAEEDYLMISGIQHFVFCRRQWALIHIDQQWAENRLTAEGQLIPQNAHNARVVEKRAGVLTVRGLRISSRTLGASGICDVVEFTQTEPGEEGAHLAGHRGLWKVLPVEYKRGKDKSDESDILQLACQVICLEEMLGCSIENGCLYYHALRHRREILITEELKQQVRDIFAEMHQYYERRRIPKVKPSRACTSCSMQDLCLPKLQKDGLVMDYYAGRFQEAGI